MEPLFVWGLFVRCLGAIYLVAFVSLFREIIALAGKNGISPIGLQLERVARDFPTWRRFVWFPTLLWIAHTDRALKGYLLVGCAAAIAIVIGGPLTPLAFLVCWLIFLSYDLPAELLYPWDSVLFEAGLLAQFLPAAALLPDVSLTAAPPVAIAWAYRFLLARVMLGFGKFKFFGPGTLRWAYLKSFVIAQPIPSIIGYRASKLPVGFFAMGLVGLAFAELIAPILIFITPETRLVAAFTIAGLMATIQLCGNFGFFNALVIALCLPLLDLHSSVFAQPLATSFAEAPVATTYAAFLLVAGCMSFPFASWVCRSWMLWPAWDAHPLTRAIAWVFRTITPFRLVHAYGVFSKDSLPPVKWVPVIEGSDDGLVWKPYRYKFMASAEDSPPRFVAPFMPRWDHFLIYEAYGISVSTFSSSLYSTGNPYRFSRSTLLERAMQRLLEGNKDVERLFAHVPFVDAPPNLIRAVCVVLEPAAPGYWRRRDVHIQVAPTGRDATLFDDWLRDPLGFHPDDDAWRRRSSAVREALAAKPNPRADWRRDEAACNRLVLQVTHAVAPHVKLESRFHLHLFALFLMAEGGLEAVLADPRIAQQRLLCFKPRAGLSVLAIHWQKTLELHAKKARLMRVIMPGSTPPPPFLPGFRMLMPELETMFAVAPDEWIPSYTQATSGVWTIKA